MISFLLTSARTENFRRIFVYIKMPAHHTHTHSNKFVSFSIQKYTKKKKLSHTPFAVYKTYVFHSGSHSLDDLLSSSRMVWKLYIYSPSCLPFCLRSYTQQNQSNVLSIVFGFWCLRNLSDFMWKRTHPPKIQFNSYFHLVLASQVRRERESFILPQNSFACTKSKQFLRRCKMCEKVFIDADNNIASHERQYSSK